MNDINTLFVDALDDKESFEKVGEYGGAYVQQRLRETSFARQVLPPIPVTRKDVQRSVDHDGFTKIIDKEPESSAMAMNFQGEPDGRYITGNRYAVNFYRIASDDFSAEETELMSHDFPITKVIEENSVKDIQTIEDTGFLKHVNRNIVDNSKHINVTGVGGKLERTALEQLVNIIDANFLKTETILMPQTVWNSLILWDHTDFGDDLVGKVTIDGYKYDTLFGRKVVTSIKEDLFRKNRVFTDAGTVTTLTTTGATSATGVFTLGATDLSMIGVGDTVVISGSGANTGVSTVVIAVDDTANTVTCTPADISDEAGAETLTVTAASLPAIYGFTGPRFLGNFYVLNQTKFVIRKQYSMIEFRAWEDIAMGIGNINATAAITLDT